MKKSAWIAAALSAGLAFAVAGSAQAAFPEKAIRVIVPFPAGGGTDAVARVLADRMSKELGQRVVVENRGGANGSIGASAVAKSAPDGYTLLMTTSTTHAANPSLLKTLSYDPVAEFSPVARIGNFPFILAINPNVAAQTVQELVAYGKANPGKLSYAYWQGTTIVLGATFKQKTGLDILSVPYAGTTPAITDVLAGRVSAIFVDVPSGLAHLKAQSLRALAVSTAERSNILPDIPSMSQAGVAGYDISSWMAVYAPANTPADIVAQLTDATLKSLADPAVKARLADLGFDVQPSNAAELGAYTKSEIAKWRELAKAAGIEPQ